MSSEAETQQPPQPAADVESPSSPAAAATAGDKKVIGKPVNKTVALWPTVFVPSKECILFHASALQGLLYIYINRFYGERVATVWSRYSDTNLILLLYPRDYMSSFLYGVVSLFHTY